MRTENIIRRHVPSCTIQNSQENVLLKIYSCSIVTLKKVFQRNVGRLNLKRISLSNGPAPITKQIVEY